jgi:hypothetical protein
MEMSRKLAVALIIIYMLAQSSQETDYGHDANMAVDALVRVFNENPSPADIGTIIGYKGKPEYRAWTDGLARYTFAPPGKGMRYVFFADGSDCIVRMGANKTFPIQKGLSYQAIEKICRDSLTGYFRSFPAERKITSYFDDTQRNGFVWTAKRADGSTYMIELYLTHHKFWSRDLNGYFKYNLKSLWEKNEEIAVYISLTD